jgi:catechol 2,3-dioxygenase-like lactoylglutathione lyase family enzyme
MKPEYKRLNHVTINVPAGEHDKVRAFYGNVLGLKEIPFPQALASTYDLIWFECLDFLIHVDFSPPFFKPAENRHPALEVKNITDVRRHYESLGAEIREAVVIPDRDRFYVLDPFGNYFEIIEMHADQVKA